MKLTVIFLLSVSLAGAQTIATKILSPSAPIKIALSPALTTTLLFPGPLSGTFGLGLVNGTNPQAAGTVQVDHPDGSNVLVLHALTETAHVLATVLLDGVLYVFDLQSGPVPDVAVTFTKADTAVPRAIAVTPEEIAAVRPKYEPELLVGFLRRAHDAALLRKLYPDLYDGYVSRTVQYVSDSGAVKTTVTAIHRFSKEDAIVLEGTVENETARPFQFDGRSATVEVANEIHPIKLLDCLRPIPAGATVPIDVVIQGDIDGGRANLSADNEFRIIFPGGIWGFKNRGLPGEEFSVPAPVKPGSIPLSQTGRAKRDVQ
jgi:hypothetical protein